MSEKVKLIVHLGMGKTGTTSIQRALRDAAKQLDDTGTKYVGMWFDMLNATYAGLKGQNQFFNDAAQDPAGLAEKFFEFLEHKNKQDGSSIFIVINESLFEKGAKIIPFFQEMTKYVDLSLVVYVRNPRSWIDSAYTQWGIVHKTKGGKIRSFDEFAPELMRLYHPIADWADALRPNLTVRRYDGGSDVVGDFKEAFGLKFDHVLRRELSKASDAELVLRAFFNERFDGEVLPHAFNEILQPNDLKEVSSHSEIIQKCFHRTVIDQLISANSGTFSVFKDQFNLDLLDGLARPSGQTDESALRNRVIDYLISIMFGQATQIRNLEAKVAELSVLLPPRKP